MLLCPPLTDVSLRLALPNSAAFSMSGNALQTLSWCTDLGGGHSLSCILAKYFSFSLNRPEGSDILVSSLTLAFQV